MWRSEGWIIFNMISVAFREGFGIQHSLTKASARASRGNQRAYIERTLSEKSLMDGVRHFQCFSILQWSSVNWTPGANISQLCSRNLSPDRTHSISQPQPQPGQSYIGDIQTTYYATNWNLSQNNQDSKYTGREKENTQRQTERDLFCSKLTQTIKIQNQATVTSQEIFVKSKEM